MTMYLVGPGGLEPRTPKSGGDIRLVERPGVLILHDMTGLHRFACAIADRLSNDGYVAAVPDLFHRAAGVFSEADVEERRRHLTDAQVQIDVDAAFAYLQAQPFIEWGKLGVLGFGMGEHAAHLAAASSPNVAFTATFSPLASNGQSGNALASKIQGPVLRFHPIGDLRQTGEAAEQVWSQISENLHTHLPRTDDAGFFYPHIDAGPRGGGPRQGGRTAH
jgi:dienelactone hydrolase